MLCYAKYNEIFGVHIKHTIRIDCSQGDRSRLGHLMERKYNFTFCTTK
jgi:hypothetical protein